MRGSSELRTDVYYVKKSPRAVAPAEDVDEQRVIEVSVVLNDNRCSIEGCESKKATRGWCSKHYQRWHRYGNPEYQVRKRIDGSPEERFWAHVDADGDCWEWVGTRDRRGYGKFRVHYTWWYAHRFAWENLVGPIQESLVIDHLCKNKSCVNPDHLEPVTTGENTRRGIAGLHAALSASKITHCPNNHAYTEENTIYNTYGHRACRTCKNEGQRRGRQRRKMRDKDGS